MFTELTKKTLPQEVVKSPYMIKFDNENPPKYYEIDPFARVYQMRNNVWEIGVESGDGHGTSWCVLLEGPQKAILMNTGWGVGNLKGLAEQLTGGKELIVVVSWPHRMTATGNFQFDNVYCHEYAVPVLEKMMSPESIDYMFDENGNGKWLVCKRSDVNPFKKYNLLPVSDGTIFDLGEHYEVEVIWTPGISPGGIALLDKTARSLYTCAFAEKRVNIGLIPRVKSEYRASEFATVPAFVDGLQKLQNRMDEYDSIFSTHDYPLTYNLSIISDWLHLGKMVIADPEAYEHKETVDTDHSKNVSFMTRSFNGLELAYSDTSCRVLRSYDAA